MDDPQQASLLKLCAKGIGVYSPHTSMDAARGGMNDVLGYTVCKGVAKSDPIICSPPIEGRLSCFSILYQAKKMSGSDD